MVLRREIPQLEASVSSAPLLRKDGSIWYGLAFFGPSIDSPVPDQPLIDVIYEVKEQASGSLSASVGFSQGEGVLLGANISQKISLVPGMHCHSGFRAEFNQRSALYTDPYYTIDGVSRGVDLYFAKTDLTTRGLQTIRPMKLALGSRLDTQSAMRSSGRTLQFKIPILTPRLVDREPATSILFPARGLVAQPQV